ncbi:hypothetical protein ACFL96_17055 [Thermoproteota archaeon]
MKKAKMRSKMHSMSRSQASLEYLLLIGLLFLIIIPIFYYSITESTDQIRMNQAEDTVNALVKTADSVYALGPGSKDYVDVTIPGGTSGYVINESEMSLILDFKEGSRKISGYSKAILIGAIPINAGRNKIPVEMLDSGVVRIGKGIDNESPEIVYTYPNGMIHFNQITLKANTNEPALCKYDSSDKDYIDMMMFFGGSLLGHENFLGVLEDGNYVFFARCIDSSGNVMNSSALINFTINTTIVVNQTNETPESDPPIVIPIEPPDGYVDNDSIVLFQYNATDASTIAFCELIIDDENAMMMTEIINASTNEIEHSGMSYGNHNWSINCTDVHGNEGTSGLRNIFIDYIPELDLPIVYLIFPPDGDVRNYWFVKFRYGVSDETSGISHCILFINGSLDGGVTIDWQVIDHEIIENVEESIDVPLFKGNYTWKIGCTDDSFDANTGYSDTRALRVNVSAGGSAYISSCAGWCGWEGFHGGMCENNLAKCGSGCGLPYNSRNDCYGGDNASDLYCTGGAEADTCCCVP